MNRNIELLAPGGDKDSIKAAILAGADAVYCGLDKFNARNRAENITFDDLQGIISLAHKYQCEVFLTLNILIVENEIPALLALLNKLVNTHIDGVIVQDLGLFYLLSHHFKSLKVHASTQATTHNAGQIKFLSRLNATRVNLSRELNLNEITSLTTVAQEYQMLTEVFVHGSNCLSFSGLCYISSVQSGNSGNRGRCSQPCRDQYLTTPAGLDYPLNLKDNSTFSDLRELAEAGVDSLKIEGRIKKFHYVYIVVAALKKQLQSLQQTNQLINNNGDLYKVFNRDFTNGYLKGEIHKNMFIDNPRDHSAQHRADSLGCTTDEAIEKAKTDLYNEKTDIIQAVREKIEPLNINKVPLTLQISGESGSPLKISVSAPDLKFTVQSSICLTHKGTEAVDRASLLKRLKSINETECHIEQLDINNLKPNLYIPFRELTDIKKQILFILNGNKNPISPIDVPPLKTQKRELIKPKLSALISSPNEAFLCGQTDATIYFQLPNAIHDQLTELIEIFEQNKMLVPWFPSILIGDDFSAAIELISKIKPKQLVTNNSGIAYEAYQAGISWIAGPYLNIANSYSLACLKETFNCSGAFISNELSRMQIKSIKKPMDFDLFYSIYHPIVLMTSRQCLFQTVMGCHKNAIDEDCIPQCEKSTTITNLKSEELIIHKTKGNYHTVYHQHNYLNTSIVSEIPDKFTHFMIDLTDVPSQTQCKFNKLTTIKLFDQLLSGSIEADSQLNQSIAPTTNSQYRKGI